MTTVTVTPMDEAYTALSAAIDAIARAELLSKEGDVQKHREQMEACKKALTGIRATWSQERKRWAR